MYVLISFFQKNRFITFVVFALILSWGLIVSPLDWAPRFWPSSPVAVDAIPDIGENQQIVFTAWPGRSPQDIDDQITFPLTSALMGVPGVKSVRSSSMLGVSNIYVIFEDGVEFYWSRSRLLEKLNALPANLLPEGVKPTLGPDATALGQIFWYTLEGRDTLGNLTGGWDLHELRSVQDYYVKYALSAAEGVAEVASVGGHVKEYHVDVDPLAMKAYKVSLSDVMKAVKNSNRDVGAKTIEVNNVEYLIRGLGYIKSLSDLENAYIKHNAENPIRIKDVAKVSLGPATRRGILDKEGAEVVGGVVVARYGANPMQVIENVKSKVAEIAPGLPRKTLADGTLSQLTLVPFYDRSELIGETIATLDEALSLEILITILVIIVMVMNLRASLLISSLLPIAVLMVFIAMKYANVEANIVALSGIAIAIGTMVDLGIILSENMLRHMDIDKGKSKLSTVIFEATKEVTPAILTAVSTTIISFIPVFAMEAAEGKLFRPLAFTKTFALVAAVVVTLFLLPAAAQLLFGIKNKMQRSLYVLFGLVGITALFFGFFWAGGTLIALSLTQLLLPYIVRFTQHSEKLPLLVVFIAVIMLLNMHWMPLGVNTGIALNFVFTLLLIGGILSAFRLLQHYYKRILMLFLEHKITFLSFPLLLVLFALLMWQGFDKTVGTLFSEQQRKELSAIQGLRKAFPGLGSEFMPSLDEGSFLLMPTSMPHAGIEENKRVLQQLDLRVAAIPEVSSVVGKLGRVESALDPAPISMYENLINYKPEFALNTKGKRERFKTNAQGDFELKDGRFLSQNEMHTQGINSDMLIPYPNGKTFRNWREHIKSPNDIWSEIANATKLPGVSAAPKLQPIETRLVMLQTGMRAPMGIKVYGPDLATIERFAFELEDILKTVPEVKKEAVFADRMVGKPYLHFDINRNELARYGLQVEDVLEVIEMAIGGMPVSTSVEGRERYNIRVRYPRELRDNPMELGNIRVPLKNGEDIPLASICSLEYVRGPQNTKSEDAFPVGYVLFDKVQNASEGETVEAAQKAIQKHIDNGNLDVPAGVRYAFSGNYENQVRANKRLSFIMPVVLLIILLILYLQFKSLSTSIMVFSGIAVAFAGGFILIYLYGQSWFMDVEISGLDLRNLFQITPLNMSVAIWIGFIALFGIATDDGVLMASYLKQSFDSNKPNTVNEVRNAVIEAGYRRVRPALMTSATTLIALLPVMTSTGRGSDVMLPMAIPVFGGMIVAMLSIFMVPVLYCLREERRINK